MERHSTISIFFGILGFGALALEVIYFLAKQNYVTYMIAAIVLFAFAIICDDL